MPIPEKFLRAAEEAEAAAEAAAIRDDADEAARQASRAMAYHAAAHSRHGTASASATPPLGAAARPKAVMGPNLGQATGSRGPTTAPTTGSPHPNTPPPSPVARRRAAREEIPLAGNLFGLLEPDTPQEAEEQFKRYIRYFKENGYDLAAKLAEHYIGASGTAYVIDSVELLQFDQFRKGIGRLQEISEESFRGDRSGQLFRELTNSKKVRLNSFNDDWTTRINSYPIGLPNLSDKNLNLYFGLGEFNVQVNLEMDYVKSDNDFEVGGTAAFSVNDRYDFRNGIGSGVTRVLEANGLAKSFEVISDFEKNFSGKGNMYKGGRGRIIYQSTIDWSPPRKRSSVLP